MITDYWSGCFSNLYLNISSFYQSAVLYSIYTIYTIYKKHVIEPLIDYPYRCGLCSAPPRRKGRLCFLQEGPDCNTPSRLSIDSFATTNTFYFLFLNGEAVATTTHHVTCNILLVTYFPLWFMASPKVQHQRESLLCASKDSQTPLYDHSIIFTH